ncbi:Pre-rRNA-processing protein fhl1 [Microbotryomycetes sp. JL221]|nr:Pre-rRNA-processing protein fhl1 [Microbotryomycetes sp. JL221]
MGTSDARADDNPLLPSFPLMDEIQPQRGEDDESMLSWARSLSPRMLPTTYGNESVPIVSSIGIGQQSLLDGTGFSSSTYRGLTGDSPTLGPIRRNQLTIGTGLSPELVPTRMGSSNDTARSGSSMMASGQAYDFPSFSSAFHAMPPSDTLFNHHHSPHDTTAQSQQQSAALTSASPIQRHKSSPLNPFAGSLPPLPPASAAVASTSTTPIASTSTATLPLEVTQYPVDGQDRPTEDDPRIQAYAKLEFPSFDIFIQKLSVIIGRRPAAAALSAAASMVAAQSAANMAGQRSTASAITADNQVSPSDQNQQQPATDASADPVVKFEDFVQAERAPSKEPEADKVKQEDDATPRSSDKAENLLDRPVPQLSVTPSSPRPPPAVDEDAKAVDSFAEFLKSSPVTGPTTANTSTVPALALDGKPMSTENDEDGPEPVQSPSVELRKPASSPSPAVTSQPPPQRPSTVTAMDDPSSLVPAGFLTDIDLGPIRAVSRQHARLFYDYDTGGWAIEVLGRNGLVVDGKWKAKGEKEPLGTRSKIQIAERIFHFVLPTSDQPSTAQQAGLEDVAEESPISELSSDSGDESSSLSELSDSDVELSPVQGAVEDEHLARVPSMPNRRPGLGKGKGKGKMYLPPRRRRRSSVSEHAEHWQDAEEEDFLRGVAEEDDEDDSYTASPPKRGHELGRLPELRRSTGGSSAINVGKKSIPSKSVPAPAPAANTRLRRRSDAQADARQVAQKNLASYKMPAKQPRKTPRRSPSEELGAQFDLTNLPPLPDLSNLPPLPAIPSRSPSATQSPAQPLSVDMVLPDLPPVPSPAATLPPPPQATMQATTISPAALKAPVAVKMEPMQQELAPASFVQGSTTPEPLAAVPSPSPLSQAAPAPPSAGPAASSAKPTPSAVANSSAAGTAPARPSPYAPAPHPPGAPYPDRAPDHDRQMKPPYTYASLVAQAIMDSPAKRLTLTAICDWVGERWPYFFGNQPGWQNSIRHNLSLARGFIKLARKPDEPGKGSFWALDPASMDAFDGHNYRKKIVKAAPAQTSASAAAATATPPSASSAPSAAAPPPPPPNLNQAAGPPTRGPTVPPVAPSAASAQTTRQLRPPQKVLPPRRAPVPINRPPAGKSVGAGSSAASSSLSQPMPIVVSPLPDSYVRPPLPPTNGNNPPDELTIALLKDPPIILHEGKLILNPGIFAHLTREQINNLQTLPASNALQILQTYVVQHFKDKMKKSAQEKAAARSQQQQQSHQHQQHVNGKAVPPQPRVAPSVANGVKPVTTPAVTTASVQPSPTLGGKQLPTLPMGGSGSTGGKTVSTQPHHALAVPRREPTTQAIAPPPSTATPLPTDATNSAQVGLGHKRRLSLTAEHGPQKVAKASPPGSVALQQQQQT